MHTQSTSPHDTGCQEGTMEKAQSLQQTLLQKPHTHMQKSKIGPLNFIMQIVSTVAAPFCIPTLEARVPVSHVLTDLCLLDFLIITVLIGVRRCLVVILLCISLITSVENLLICLLATWMSLEKCLVTSLVHCLIRVLEYFCLGFSFCFIVFVFLVLICRSFLKSTSYRIFRVYIICKYVSHSIDCLFILLIVSFVVQKLFSLILSSSAVFPVCLVSYSWNTIPSAKT